MKTMYAVAILLFLAAGFQSCQAALARAACPCNRMYKPVCDRDGNPMAPNRCEADCSGLNPSEFHEEWCNVLKRPICNCLNAEPTPVCDAYGKQVAENRCLANCQQLPQSLFSELWCLEHRVHETMCGCPQTYQPVCDVYGKEVALNKCQAQCKGMTWGSLHAVGHCVNTAPASPPSALLPSTEAGGVACGCPDTYEPVCDIWGKEVARNKCEASCKQQVWGSIFAFSLCPAADEPSPDAVTDFEEPKETHTLLKGQDVTFDLAGPAESTVEAEVAASQQPGAASAEPEVRPQAAPCVCTMIFAPVCDAMGKQLASSPCQARCMGLPASSYSEEWCGKPSSKSPERRGREEDCGCPSTGRRVCDRDGRQVAVNRCLAWCQGLRPNSFSTWNCYAAKQTASASTKYGSDLFSSESSSGTFSWSSQDSASSQGEGQDTASDQVSDAWSSSQVEVGEDGQDYGTGAPSPAPALDSFGHEGYEWDVPLYLDNTDALLGGVEDELLEDEALLPVDGIMP